MVLAFLGAYRLCLMNPLWLHISGASSSGKTTIALQWLLEGLYRDHVAVDTLTPHTLLSGMQKGVNGGNGKSNSLLHRIGSRGIVIFKDLTNLLSRHEDAIKAVAGMLRQVFDGHAKSEFGIGASVEWKGNLSVITAMTPDAEAEWMKYQNQGERFLIIKWRSPKQKMGEISEVALKAMSDNGDDGSFHERMEAMRDRVRELMEFGELTVPEVPDREQMIAWGLPQMAKMITVLRTAPTREDGRWASYVTDLEQPGRVSRQLINAGKGLASIRRRLKVGEEEGRLIKRIGFDSIPLQRRWILEKMLYERYRNNREKVMEAEIYESTPFEKADDFRRHIRDMKAIGVMRVNKGIWERDIVTGKQIGRAHV